MSGYSSTFVGLETSTGHLGPFTQASFSCGTTPSARCEPLTASQWIEISQAAASRLDTESSHRQNFMSQRAGSTIISPPDSAFNKGLGSHFYIPPSRVRLRDECQDPSLTRDLADSFVPPMLYAKATRVPLNQLKDDYDFHAFKSFVSGSLMRRGFTQENERLFVLTEKLKGELDASDNNLARALEELGKERERYADLSRDKEKIEEECMSLKEELAAFAREKKASEDEVSRLTSNLQFKDVAIDHKNAELTSVRSSLQKEIDDLRAEVDLERSLKADSIARVGTLEARVGTLETDLVSTSQRRRDLLAIFPELFRRLLSHPDVKRSFDGFNNATLVFGQHVGSRELAKRHPDLNLPILYPRAYHDLQVANDAWKAMAFPILEQMVQDLDAPVEDMLSFLAPVPPPAV